MRTVFFATTSLNFGNIFSSESISPQIFYSKRGYGFDHFENIFPNVTDFIVLFKDFPDYKLNSTSEEESYKIVLELIIHDEFLVEANDGIILYPDTIHLNLNTLKRIYFFSSEEKLRIIAKSESSRSLKTIDKYKARFDSDSQFGIRKTFYKVDGNYKNTSNVEKLIARDRLYNAIKGALYGFICGQSYNKSAEEISYLKSLQDLKNNFALLKNNLAHKIIQYQSKNKKNINYNRLPDIRAIDSISENLEKSINENKYLLKKIIGDFNDKQYKIEFLKYTIAELSIDKEGKEVFNFLDKFLKKYKNLNTQVDNIAYDWVLGQKSKDPSAVFLMLERSIQSYKTSNNKDDRDCFDSDVLKATFELKYIVESFFADKLKPGNLDIDIFSWNNPEEPIKLNYTNYLDNTYSIILNILIRNTKQSKGKVGDEYFLPIVEAIGNKTYKENEGKSLALYRYLNKEIPNYIEPKNASILSKNLIAFIFNPNEIEKLQKYLEVKDINSPYYAFSFFGAFNGFASLSRNFTAPIFKNQNFANKIDEYLINILDNINASPNLNFYSPKTINQAMESFPTYAEIVEQVKKMEVLNSYNDDLIYKERINSSNLRQKFQFALKKIKFNLTSESKNILDLLLDQITEETDFFQVPVIEQEIFIKGRIKELLLSTYKLNKLGEKSISKLLEII